MSHYTSHSVVIQDTSDASPTIVGSLTNVSVPIDQEVLKDQTAGRAFLEQLSVVGQKPRATFSTFDLPKIISGLGLTGRLLVEATGTKPGLAVVQAQYNDGTLVAGSNHRRLRFARSHARINRISVSHRQDAVAEAEAVSIWDGTNAPILVETSQALPTLPVSAGRWTLHSVRVGSADITCNTQVDIDFGISVDAFGCDGDIYDTHFHVNQIAPMVNITSLDPANFASAKVVLAGLVGTQVNSRIVLRKRTATAGSFVTNGTAEHIVINFAGVILPIDVHNASGNQKAQSTFRIETVWDGTNAPLVFNTASAIS